MNRLWLEGRSAWVLGCMAVGLAGAEACGTSSPSSSFPASTGNDDTSDQDAAPSQPSGDAATGGSSSGGSGSSSSGGTSGPTDASAGGSVKDAPVVVGGDSGGIVGAGDAGTCPAPSGIDSQQMTALQIINTTRAAMGSPCAHHGRDAEHLRDQALPVLRRQRRQSDLRLQPSRGGVRAAPTTSRRTSTIARPPPATCACRA